jgi:hypothetical protein
MLRSIPKTRPNGLKQFGIVNAQHFMNLFSKSGQNRSQKTFYEFVNSEITKFSKTARLLFVKYEVCSKQEAISAHFCLRRAVPYLLPASYSVPPPLA